jgi:antitoxin (DNA-binding transcriptional repressor) of toxin-antitoxin stability system
MKAFTTEELRGKASDLRKVISRDPQAVLTASGEPVALLVPVDRDTLAETADAIGQARAQLAVKAIRYSARKMGRDRITTAQIDRIIANARKARHRRSNVEKRRS